MNPAHNPTEFDVARPLEVSPRYRTTGLHAASSDDVAYLWREAHGYFERARATDDEQAAERLRRLGTGFAVMAVSLLQEIGRAMQPMDRAVTAEHR